VRKSSLVECPGADNVSRLKHRTEAVDVTLSPRREGMVGERCVLLRSPTARTGGAHTRENAGMSSVISVTTTDTVSLRVPGQRQTSQGQSGPKPRTLQS
jgi:hypothetical protein